MLTLAGFGFVCLAAFSWRPWLGFLAVGLSCLALEFLTNPEAHTRNAPAGQRS